MSEFAYVRVSSKDQNVDRQLKALQDFSLDKAHIYIDYQSGKDFERPAYKKLIRRLRPGDLVIIKSIDRLGRNYEEILEQWRTITKVIKANIVVLDMPLLETREKDENLTGTLIADLVLQILAYVAQKEREFIRQRQAEGIAAAKAKGARFGRKPLAMPDEFEKICRRCAAGEISIRKAAGLLGIESTTFYRKYKKFLNKRSNIQKN